MCACVHAHVCVLQTCVLYSIGHYSLVSLQAVGDGGQGWSNALIYIFLSPTIRRQLFFYPFVRLIFYISRKLRTSQGKNGDPIHVSQRRFSKRENTHGVDGSSVQEVEGQDELVDGRDSGVEAEMTSVSSR